MELREAGPADLAGVLSLWRNAEADQTVTDDRVSLGLVLEHPTTDLLLAVDGERVLGTLIVAWDGWRGGLYRLAVAPDERRAGVASALVSEGERRLREAGCRRISVLALRGHDHAAGFWNAVGYELDERLDRYMKPLDPG
jgi:ribosomal protein S18 acetylase RimI-like enzyme